MSGYRGRTGPNFSEYLNNLNTVSPPYDSAAFGEDILDLNQDLSLFTNADFTSMDDPAFNFELPNDAKNEVSYEEYLGAQPAQAVNQQSPANSNHYYSTYNTPIQPAPAQNFPQVDNVSPILPNNTQGRKKPEAAPVTVSPEERSRLAAEEDKRRRNTAASARFRVKKKQREQALEKNLKEAQDKTSKLESKINQLEMENKWLKDLITEKNGMQSKEEMAAAYKQYRKESEEREVKEEQPHVTGVCTN